ncbi:hypothetical protein V490_01085 [Pseudogymnoascus sp. VKM F-3557]|nr:hypothetical protein V490_01085 [Pseudogymnoascus sp. VKM F-3557]
MILRCLQNIGGLPLLFVVISLLIGTTTASVGDRLPEFRECLEICKKENCQNGDSSVALFHRLLLWSCPAECDYTCQHIITDMRVSHDPPLPVVQFHGKWPFHRILGMQEPLSVIFSLLNYAAHYQGLHKIRKFIPASYPLRKYYINLAYVGMVSWIASSVFHTRDFQLTEELDYFGAGANVLYGLYYTPIRVFRLDKGGARAKSVVRAWTTLCILLFLAHVTYLKYYSWDYTYNMAANIAAGVLQNAMWTYFSITRYRQSKRIWAAWPGIVVAWVIIAMSLELLDFPPIGGHLDAHALWHLGTVFPTVLFYNFLLRDSQDDIAGARLKA